MFRVSGPLLCHSRHCHTVTASKRDHMTNAVTQRAQAPIRRWFESQHRLAASPLLAPDRHVLLIHSVTPENSLLLDVHDNGIPSVCDSPDGRTRDLVEAEHDETNAREEAKPVKERVAIAVEICSTESLSYEGRTDENLVANVSREQAIRPATLPCETSTEADSEADSETGTRETYYRHRTLRWRAGARQ